MTGVSIFIRNRITGAKASASFSLFCVAIVFGVISPKTRIRNVMMNVAILTAAPPPNDKATIEAILAANVLTRLFPIRIALSILASLSYTFINVFARLLPSSASERILIRLHATSEVSADEKKPDSRSRTIKTIICFHRSSFMYVLNLLISMREAQAVPRSGPLLRSGCGIQPLLHPY